MRTRPRKWRPRQWSPPPTALRTPSMGAWVCWGRPGWTIRELSLAWLRLLCISAKCWVLDDRAPAAELVESRVTRPESGVGEVRRGTRLLRSARREQERQRCGDQTRLSKAGARTASRRQSRRRSAGEVQRNQHGLRGAV